MEGVWLLVGILFVTGGLFVYLQFFTLVFEKHYLAGSFMILLVGGLLAALAVAVVWHPSRHLLSWGIGVVAAFLSLLALAVFFVKVLGLPEGRFRTSHSLLRTYTDFSVPNRKFSVMTDDNVMISGVHIGRGKHSVIIVCHGGGRSKNILGNVMLCEWLAETFDIITFDFRGHFESGGALTGDGATSLDVKAVIEYARENGYERVGVVGRSLGAWSAVLEVAEFKNVDSLIVAAAHLGHLRDALVIRQFPAWAMSTFGKVFARILLGVRLATLEGEASMISAIGKVSPIPLLLVYCESDPTTGMVQEHVERLFAEAQAPKKLVIFEGHAHILETRYLQRYCSLVRDWFEKTLPSDRSDSMAWSSRSAVSEREEAQDTRGEATCG